MAQLRAHNLINEYVNSSFMSANEKFNSAMVFETQPDQLKMKRAISEEEKVQRLIGQQQEDGDVEMEEAEDANEGERMKEASQLELDNVN